MASDELKTYSHELKVHPGPYRDLELGIKTGEVRQCNDRDFQPGHLVVLREYAPDSGYTGRTMRRLITHVQRGYGLPNGLCVLSYAQDFDAMRQRAEKAEQRADELAAMVRATLGQQVKT